MLKRNILTTAFHRQMICGSCVTCMHYITALLFLSVYNSKQGTQIYYSALVDSSVTYGPQRRARNIAVSRRLYSADGFLPATRSSNVGGLRRGSRYCCETQDTPEWLASENWPNAKGAADRFKYIGQHRKNRQPVYYWCSSRTRSVVTAA